MIVSNYLALPDFSWVSVNSNLTSLGAPVVLTFSFPSLPSAAGLAYYAGAAGSFVGFNEKEQQLARAALGQWAAVSGVTFIEVAASEGDIQFQWMDFGLIGQGQFAGLGSYPRPEFIQYNGATVIPTLSTPTQNDLGGDTFYNVRLRDTFSDASFTGVLLHEIGHALGLKHSFDVGYNNSNTLAANVDNRANTVMSYTGTFNGFLGPLDIAAIRYLYGDETKDGQQFTSFGYDGATRTIYSSGSDQGELLYGNSGTNDFIRARGGNDFIASRSGNDRIFCGDGDDQARGGLGDDLIFGGAGLDTAAFSGPRSSYTIQHQSFAEYAVTGPDGIDAVVNVERLQFSDQYLNLDTSSDYQVSATKVYQKMILTTPGIATVSNMASFEADQYEYGRHIGVLDPALYVFQALGLALSEHTGSFANNFGPSTLASDHDYILAAYQSALGHAPTQPQIDHFQLQVDYFQSIYTDSGAYGSATRIDLLVRGAVYGQMLGIADELGLLV